jgi:hypothetical protein
MFRSQGCVDVRLAGARTHYLCPPKDINMRVPDQLLKCTGFISHDLSIPKWMGTMFVVGVESELGGGGYLHLVTAKHVAEKIDPGPFVIAMNGKDGRPLWLKSGDEWRWWYHPTEADKVDVAVIPFTTARLPEYDVEWIHESCFVTDDKIKKYGIGIGDELTMVGLFAPYYGLRKFVSVVRTGNVALIPPDPIPIKDFGDMEAYLADVRAIKGFSGSPVLVRNTMNLPPIEKDGELLHFSGMGSFHLFGLMHGHWPAREETIAGMPAEVHSGISIIVPAKKILEVLYHPELVEMRKEMDKRETESKYPVADAADDNGEAPRITKAEFEAALKKVSRKTTPKK